MNLITNNEVINNVFNRNIDELMIKPSMLFVSQINYVEKYLGELYDDIIENETGYTQFIDEYIKPVISWGVLYDNFEYISMSITDKGIIQMLVEGTANLIGSEARYNAKLELKKNLNTLIQLMQNQAYKLKNEGDDLFKNFELKNHPSLFSFTESNIRYNIRPY